MSPHGFDTATAICIGSGGSAEVYRVRHENGKEYAIKASRTFDTAELGAANRSSLLNEVRLLSALAHPHIVAFKETFLTRDRQFVCVAMELLRGGTLADAIKQRAAARQHLPERLVWSYFLQLATAVAHMHAAGVVHRDLKPSNCMFSDTTRSQLKVLDLGLARRLVLVDHTLSQAGTPAYAAPEVYNRQPMSFPVDVWSLGCILHELCALEPAFNGLSIRELRAQVLLGVSTPLNEHCSSELRQLLAAMLQPDPAQRITMQQLLAHPAVAPRLQQLQAQGLVGVAPAEAIAASGEQAALEANHAAARTPAARGASTLVDPGTLDRLLELLPPPRHSSATEEVLRSSPHTPDAQLSAWYASGPAAAFLPHQQSKGRPRPEQAPASSLVSHQAAVLQALQLPRGLADSPKKQPGEAAGQATIVIHVDAFSGASSSGPGDIIGSSSNISGSGSGGASSAPVAAPAVQPAPLLAAPPAGEREMKRQRSLSLPDRVEAAVQPQLPAVLAQLHPKFRKMAEEALQFEAAGTCRPRPTCTQRASPSGSPAKAPGSPQPAGSGQSANGAAGTPRTRPPAPRCSAIDSRALEARIEEVKRCGGGAAALAAAVRASLAEHDAALLRHITERVNSARSTPRATPRARAAAAAASIEAVDAGALADELAVERSLPSSPAQMGAQLGPSPLARPLSAQQPEEPVAAEALTAAACEHDSTAAEMQQQQRSVGQQSGAGKLRGRWSIKSLLQLRRRSAQ